MSSEATGSSESTIARHLANHPRLLGALFLLMLILSQAGTAAANAARANNGI